MYAEAEATLKEAVEKFPSEAEPHRRLVQLLFEQRAWKRAGELLLRWCEAEPDNLERRAQLNRARVEVGFLDAAEADLDSWPADWRESPSYALVRGRLLTERQQHQAALSLLQETLERFPGLHDARSQLVAVLTQLGRAEEANRHQQFLSRFAPSAAIDALQNSDRPVSDEQIETLWTYAKSPALGRELRAHSLFALGRIYDARKDYDTAFDAIHQANACVHEQLSYDWREHRRLVQRTMNVFTEEFVADRSGHVGHTSHRPIFVLGMPRSGTTLVEQILASHPVVFGAGELNFLPRVTQLMPKVVKNGRIYPQAVVDMSHAQFADAAQYYLDRLSRIDRDAEFVVDKLPHNFDRIGLIRLLFPNATVIHLARDARDVAVSNYYQNFAAKHGLMGFAFDLGDIGHMLNDHDRIMAHWHELFPGQIYELSYEALVRDPETEIAKLLDHCGLPWDDRVMRFYETQRPVKTASVRQVREGIYTTSAEKWRRYERHLGPLEEVLAEGFKPVGPPQGKDATPAAADAGTTAAGTALAPDPGATASNPGRTS
jgi:tetratricopeptide (TPR) repeat protein